MIAKPIKRIALVDAGKRPEIIHPVLDFIKDRYDFEITRDTDADYVFHSCLGYDVLKYHGVRIFVTGEYVSPNFNLSDYALAFDPISFGDRYCQLPLLKMYREAYAALCAPRADPKTILAQKDGFCAYVMSNMTNSAAERTDIFDLLSNYKPVHSGGKWRNNVGGPVADKIAFQSHYKFALAIENHSAPGYLTEKFAQAAQSNVIPIYWGDPDIAKTFNPRAFINCHDFDSFAAVAERVREIDENEALYLNMLAEPWFINGQEPEALKDETFIRFLCNIFDQPHEQAYRRNRSRWGIKHDKRIYNMAFRPLWNFAQTTYKKFLKKS